MRALVALLIAGALCGCTTEGGFAPDYGSERTTTESVAATSSARGLVGVTVTRVTDGDTIRVLLPGGVEERIRLIGVDTPESTIEHEPYGEEASAFTKAHLTKGRRVFLEFDVQERDRYDRMLAYVWLEPPTSFSEAEARAKLFNARLVIEGYAQPLTIPPDVRYSDLFVRFSREARAADRGLWALEP